MNLKLRYFLIVIVVGIVSTFATYESGIFAPTIVSGDGQINQMSFEEKVKRYDLVLVGTVQSIETKTVDESWTSSPALFDEEDKYIGSGESTYLEKHVPYQHVTLKVDEYLKDATGKQSDIITVLDRGEGLGTFNGIKHKYKYDLKTEYKVGDKSLYFVWKHPDTNNLHTSGYISKYNINENNVIQSDFSNRVSIELSSKTSGETTDYERDLKEWNSPIPLEEAISKAKQVIQKESER